MITKEKGNISEKSGRKWFDLPPGQRIKIIAQVFALLLYMFAYLAYIGETGHFRLTPQLVLWLFGAMIWTISCYGINPSQTILIQITKFFSTISFLVADILIVLFIIGMVDFSITSRGYRRALGLVIPIAETPVEIKVASEVFTQNSIGKELEFFTEKEKHFVKIKLKYKPIPETINFWEGVLSFPPSNFRVGSGTTFITEVNGPRILALPDMQYTVRYSYDTKENRSRIN